MELKNDTPYGNLTLGWIYLHKKQYKQAIEYFEKLPSDGIYWRALTGYGYTKSGQREKALALWKEVEELSSKQWVNPCFRGMMAAYLGFTDKAFELLSDAVANKAYPTPYINFYQCTEDIRKDPRYNELLRKMNLPLVDVVITSN